MITLAFLPYTFKTGSRLTDELRGRHLPIAHVMPAWQDTQCSILQNSLCSQRQKQFVTPRPFKLLHPFSYKISRADVHCFFQLPEIPVINFFNVLVWLSKLTSLFHCYTSMLMPGFSVAKDLLRTVI